MMDETELIERGWRRCAAGQRTTQWCAQAEGITRTVMADIDSRIDAAMRKENSND